MAKKYCPNVIRVLLLAIINFNTFTTFADYKEYYHLINRAEEKFILKRDKSCFRDYDAAFAKFTPYLKDPYIAAQIAFYLGDTAKCYSYFKICFNNGMPITALKSAPLFKKNLIVSNLNKLSDLYSKEFKERQMDTALNNQLCMMCYQSDSIKVKFDARSEMFYNSEDASRKFILDSLLKKGLFANERLVGITTERLLADFHARFQRTDVYAGSPFGKHSPEEFELRRKCPYNLILHSKCFFRNNKDLFYQAMLNGYLHPKEFAILEETSIIWHKNEDNKNDECPKLEFRICYNINSELKAKTSEEIEIAEKNRTKIYMQKYSIDLQKKKLENETGFAFFFDFHDRPN